MRRATSGVWSVALVIATASCGSTDPSRAADRDPAEASRADGRAEPGRVSIPPGVHGELTEWMAVESTMIADVIEIEATRIPFAEQLATETTRETDREGKRIVERTEGRDPVTGVPMLTLTNRSGFTTTIETQPSVRLGGGRRFIATDRLVVRYLPPPSTDRPITLTAVGRGRARLLVVDPPRRLAGDVITQGAEIAQGPRGYEFRSSEGK